ncbi:Hypothetical predicted protein [Lecanosticta acicola]|uniref:Heterokaryon incompatibility domain-containing protein n=1 Tax=Lecanosticta acicola TaxID=111012 RepID=A0AAI9ED41_9PEZI|nr:Hypothetical predicted protein [Lecanosticta acicola]
MDQLCSQCINLDLAKLRSGSAQVSIGRLHEIASRAETCSFCFLIKTCVTTGAAPTAFSADETHAECFVQSDNSWPGYWDDRDLWNGKIDGITRNRVGDERPPRFTGHDTRHLTVHLRPEIKLAPFSYRRDIIIVADTELPRSTWQFHGRLLKQGQVDFHLIRQWQRLCKIVHGKRCSHPEWLQIEEPVGLRVIDIETRAIVAAPAGCQYSALSYVWGDPRHQFLMHENDFPQKPNDSYLLPELPRTLEDAIHATSELGLRYLWVDSVCIAQKPAVNQDKRHQLQQIDRIYKCAEIVIIAAACQSASDGIHGVRLRQTHSVTSRFQGTTFALAQPTYKEDTEDTTWSRRAWTYQESMLARRALMFGPSQAYWLCQCDSWRESVVLEPTEPGEDDFVPRLLPDLSQPPSRCFQLSTYDLHDWFIENDSNALSAYRDVVTRYTFRRMAYPNDGVNAIMGVLQLLQQFDKSGSLKIHFGIPEAYFDVCLLWTPRTFCQRPKIWLDNERIPSWSWAGWFSNVGVGVVWDLATSGVNNDVSNIITSVSWYLVDQKGQSMPMPKHKKHPSIWRSTESKPPCGIDLGRTNEPPPRIKPEILPRGGGCLHFLTTTCCLHLGFEIAWDDHSYFEPQPAKAYSLITALGQFAGTMIMSEETANTLQAPRVALECIFLSFSNDFDDVFWPESGTADPRRRPVEIAEHNARDKRRDDWAICNIMWVERDGNGVAERKLIGKVIEEVWLSMQPKTEWILLG